MMKARVERDRTRDDVDDENGDDDDDDDAKARLDVHGFN